jgi:hypothetical protein
VAYEPERWHDLFVMLGGSAGALAGLVFVGLSLHVLFAETPVPTPAGASTFSSRLDSWASR